ncbi:MAG: CFI-box-CTERM domain-containing protein, partial [Nitrosopumilus sp.]
QKFESAEHKITFSVPEGWLLQEPKKLDVDSPDVVAVGPKIGEINPVISLVIQDTNQRTLDDLISEKTKKLTQGIESGDLTVISQEKTIVNDNQAYFTQAEGIFSTNDEKYDIKFQEFLIYDTEKFYTLLYSNGIDDFDSQLPRFEDSINSFEILSDTDPIDGESMNEVGGCLIATAAFGSELAPQVQQLRELRDNTVLSTESGIAFMSGFNQLYYFFSPTIADLEREYPIFKEIVKLSITPMISTLSILNYSEIDSEQELLSYGIGIILMNIGIYFVAPAMIFYRIKNFI